jgi:hypothetical protein
MSRSLFLAPVLALFLIPACSASEASAPAPVTPAQAQPASTTDAKAVCVEVFTRNRTCTDPFIPALVDLRAKYDQPAGIADAVAKDRDKVIAQAKEEWATDSQPEAIDATCTKITASLGPGDQAEFGGVQGCLAKQDCGAYTTCVMPYFEKRFAR